MKSEAEIWRELQRVRELNAAAVTAGRAPNPLLNGAEQALGWALDQLRSPGDSDEMRRRQNREMLSHRKWPRGVSGNRDNGGKSSSKPDSSTPRSPS